MSKSGYSRRYPPLRAVSAICATVAAAWPQPLLLVLIFHGQPDSQGSQVEEKRTAHGHPDIPCRRSRAQQRVPRPPPPSPPPRDDAHALPRGDVSPRGGVPYGDAAQQRDDV